MRVIAVIAAALTIAAAAGATAPPVKHLPAGTLSEIKTTRGELVSIALPKKSGLSWRLARNTNTNIVREVSEADVDNAVVIVFKALKPGHANVIYAQTRGESTTAKAAKTFSITVKP
jgi:predicted secreted protein